MRIGLYVQNNQKTMGAFSKKTFFTSRVVVCLDVQLFEPKRTLVLKKYFFWIFDEHAWNNGK